MAANYSEAKIRALASGLVAGLSLGLKSLDAEVAAIVETAVSMAKAIHDDSVKSVQIR